jgi:hypothetical protein
MAAPNYHPSATNNPTDVQDRSFDSQSADPAATSAHSSDANSLF